MANKAAIECVDPYYARSCATISPLATNLSWPLGDFRQVALVLRDVTAPAAVFDSSIRSSSLWRNFTIHPLTQPIHNADDPAYARWLD